MEDEVGSCTLRRRFPEQTVLASLFFTLSQLTAHAFAHLKRVSLISPISSSPLGAGPAAVVHAGWRGHLVPSH